MSDDETLTETQATEPVSEATEPVSPKTPLWKKPLIVGTAAALLTLGATSIYVSGVIGQWEDHSAQLEDELDAVTAQRDRAESRAEVAEGALSDVQAELEARAGAVTAAEQAVAAREAAVTATEQQIAATTIREGMWVVGRDIEAGTYRTAAAVGSDCYWGIYRSGSNGDDIIANDIPGGGFPTVTLSGGQDFKTARCGSWVKQ